MISYYEIDDEKEFYPYGDSAIPVSSKCKCQLCSCSSSPCFNCGNCSVYKNKEKE